VLIDNTGLVLFSGLSSCKDQTMSVVRELNNEARRKGYMVRKLEMPDPSVIIAWLYTRRVSDTKSVKYEDVARLVVTASKS
jgi:hypothetical protein